MKQRQTDNVPTETISAARLRWQCRRGMLELDLLLNTFLDNGYIRLSTPQQQTFQLLLSYPDQTLYELLMDSMVSSDPVISDMVSRVRGCSAQYDVT